MIPCLPDKAYIPFQIDAILKMHESMGNVLLADEMGLGKTIQALGYINLVKPEKVLVVCPNTLRINWCREAIEWLVDNYQIEQCTTQLFIPPDDDENPLTFIVASYEGVKKYGPLLSQTKWDLLIVDEAHFCKSPLAQRSVATYNLPATKKIYMTGTPIVNYPYELFPLIHSLDPTVWVDFPSFEARYCYGPSNKYSRHLEELQSYLRFGKPGKPVSLCRDCQHRDYFHQTCSCPSHERGQHCNFEDYGTRAKCLCQCYIESATPESPPLMIRRLKKEVLQFLPKKRRQVIEIPADGKLAELVKLEKMMWDSAHGKGVYDAILAGLEILKEGDNDEAFELIVEQLTASRRYFFEEISRIRHAIGVAKVPEVIEHIENILESEDKVVLFAHHHDVMRAILNHFKETAGAVLVDGTVISVEERDNRIQKFQNDPECKLFIGSMRIAGLGLTLTAAHHVIFAELDWTPAVLSQCEDRLHRIGQEHNILIQHLVVEGSMDSFMAKKVIAKQKQIRRALDEPVTSKKKG